MELTPYKQWAPTSFDRRGLSLDDRQDWLVLPVTQTRDSGPLDRSNFESALKSLGGESDHVEVHRFGHWGPGWVEIIIVDPSNEGAVKEAQDICNSLENYPSLDDEHLSELELEEFNESWDSWGQSDYINRLGKELMNKAETSPLGYPMESLCEELGEMDMESSGFLDKAKEGVNWLYESCNDGVSINIAGLVSVTDIDQVINELDKLVYQRHVDSDIRKLCTFAGLAHLADEAVKRGCRLLSEIRRIQVNG